MVKINSLTGKFGVTYPLKGNLYSGLDWVIVGGESGPNARPMHPDWVRSIRDQCQAAGVPFFFKQWGEWICAKRYPNEPHYFNKVKAYAMQGYTVKNGNGAILNIDGTHPENGSGRTNVYPLAHMWKVGKKKAGRLLDGKEYHEYPTLKTEVS
jgi:protein gp37